MGAKGAARVTFVLTDWVDVAMAGFSHQNVIFELYLREPGHREAAAWERGVGMQSGDHELILEPTFGAYGTIRGTISKIELTERYDREKAPRR